MRSEIAQPCSGVPLQRAQDEQVERAGQQIGYARHGVDCRHYRVLVSTVNTKVARIRRRYNPGS